MYVSDYGFAASPSAWTTQLGYYHGEAIKNVNWMYIRDYEWTISRCVPGSDGAFRVTGDGNVYGFPLSLYGLSVRPVFSLTSSVNYASGDGTKNSPIRVN